MISNGGTNMGDKVIEQLFDVFHCPFHCYCLFFCNHAEIHDDNLINCMGIIQNSAHGLLDVLGSILIKYGCCVLSLWIMSLFT